MEEISTRKALLERCSFDGNVSGWKEQGARLTPQQIEFLGDALWQGYRQALHHTPRAMKPAQRGLKKSIVDGAGASLTDLEILVGLLRPRLWATPAWFSLKDIRRALPAPRVQELIAELTWIGEREYADPILAALRSYYRHHGENVVVIREP
jgi:hypothetical protein